MGLVKRSGYVSSWKSRRMDGPKMAEIRMEPKAVSWTKQMVSAQGPLRKTLPLGTGLKSRADSVKNIITNGMRKKTYVEMLLNRCFSSRAKKSKNICWAPF